MAKYKDPKSKRDKKTMLSFRVPETTLKSLDGLAKKKGVQRTELLVSIMEDYIEWEKKRG